MSIDLLVGRKGVQVEGVFWVIRSVIILLAQGRQGNLGLGACEVRDEAECSHPKFRDRTVEFHNNVRPSGCFLNHHNRTSVSQGAKPGILSGKTVRKWFRKEQKLYAFSCC